MDRILAIVTLLAAFVSVRPGDAAEQPNIVFLFADDLGYGDLGCYGHPYARTPVLDQLAREGTRFESYYVTGVTCNPSRTGLMTGWHPARFPRYAANFGFGDRVTITELLKQNGYKTGHFGKWHIGPEDADGTYGIDTVRVVGKSKDRSVGRDRDLYSEAIQFIRDNADGPFYVNVWGHATHYPVTVSDKLAEQFGTVTVDRRDFSNTIQSKFDDCVRSGGDLDTSMRQYLADVAQIDRNVGRLLKTLDDLGLRENTIVVFSSDHGPAPVVVGKQGVREHSTNMVGYAGPFRGGKHTQYEGGVRVPFIIRWPGKVKAGRVDSDSVCSFIDWLPTLCAITGIDDLPNGLDGKDISDIWFGATRERTQPLFWKSSAVRSTPSVRSGDWKLHMPLRRGQAVELYNLSTDPSERENVAAEHPQVVAELRNLTNTWLKELPTRYEKPSKSDK